MPRFLFTTSIAQINNAQKVGSFAGLRGSAGRRTQVRPGQILSSRRPDPLPSSREAGALLPCTSTWSCKRRRRQSVSFSPSVHPQYLNFLTDKLLETSSAISNVADCLCCVTPLSDFAACFSYGKGPSFSSTVQCFFSVGTATTEWSTNTRRRRRGPMRTNSRELKPPIRKTTELRLRSESRRVKWKISEPTQTGRVSSRDRIIGTLFIRVFIPNFSIVR